MKWRNWIGVVTVLISQGVLADAVLDGYRGNLETNLQRIASDSQLEVDRANKTYLKLLGDVKAGVQAKGSLEKTTEVVKEMKRFETAGGLSNGNFSFPELRKVHDAFASELLKIERMKASKTRDLLRKYDGVLEKLQKSRVQQDDLVGAQAVKAERERAKSASPRPAVSATANKLVQVPKDAVTFSLTTTPSLDITGKWHLRFKGLKTAYGIELEPDGTGRVHRVGANWLSTWKIENDTLIVLPSHGKVMTFGISKDPKSLVGEHIGREARASRDPIPAF